jgi:ribonuclease HI
MWKQTRHGLYRQFNFEDFKHAWAFMERVAALAEEAQHHPRWENEWSVVQIWLITHEGGKKVTGKDHDMAAAIDRIYAESGPSGEKPADAGIHPDKVKIFADGGSRGNPGPSASGYVIIDEEDNVLVDHGVYLGVTTNNQAEYTALKLALEECLRLGVRKIQIYMDSLLVVNQMKGTFKVRNRDLWTVHDAIKQLVTQFDEVEFNHVPREFNKLADAAVNRALDKELDNE